MAPDKLGGVKVFKQQSKAALPVTPLVAEIFWQNYNMFASLIQMAGPNLTPQTMAANAPKLGSRGGGTTGFSRRAFEEGEQSWTRDVFISYWVKGKTSPFNRKRGAFGQADGGRRYGLGQFARAAQPPVPTVDKRR